MPKPSNIKPSVPAPAKEKGKAPPISDEMLASEILKTTGTSSPSLQTSLAHNVISALYLPADGSAEERQERISAALALMKGIRPQNEIEGMLAAQMIAVHSAAIECFCRATLAGQGIEARDMNLHHAERFVAIYTRQLEALDKHRSKGNQTLTVKQVMVDSGDATVNSANQANSPASDRVEPPLRLVKTETAQIDLVARDPSVGPPSQSAGQH